MKIGLVDDRLIDLEKMNAIVTGIPGVEVVFCTQSAEEAYAHIKKENIDLLVADIEMPNLSGYELADIIHSHALNIAVIFVTANSGYAVHAFELNVHDYIMKPYTKERLIKSIERLMEKTRSAEMTGRLYIKRKNDIHIRNRILFSLRDRDVPQPYIQSPVRLLPIKHSMSWRESCANGILSDPIARLLSIFIM